MDSGNRVKESEFSGVYIQRLSILRCYQKYSSGVENRHVFVVTSDTSLLMWGIYIQAGFVHCLPVSQTQKHLVSILLSIDELCFCSSMWHSVSVLSRLSTC